MGVLEHSIDPTLGSKMAQTGANAELSSAIANSERATIRQSSVKVTSQVE